MMVEIQVRMGTCLLCDLEMDVNGLCRTYRFCEKLEAGLAQVNMVAQAARERNEKVWV